MNDFSLLCRLFGNLFYRQPTDPILHATFTWLAQGNLHTHWALATDSQSEKALTILEKEAKPTVLASDYQRLFTEQCVATTLTAYGISIPDFIQFRQQRAMPELHNYDHIALLLLTASWIEDNLASLEAQNALFETFVLPAFSRFLGQVEAFDNGFYRALAQLTRDALSAMADELEESLGGNIGEHPDF